VAVYAVLLTERGPLIVKSLEELARAVSEAGGRAYIVLVEGRVIGAVEARLLESPLQGLGGVRPQVEGRATGAPRGLQPGGAPPRARVAAVFDQMFRGFADIVAREISDERLELHEVVGRGLEKPVRVGRIYKQPAHDDYDVLSLVERLASEGKHVVFFTGDKRLANQAAALGMENVKVEYMPPNEYPGKESLAKAMIESVRKALKSLDGA